MEKVNLNSSKGFIFEGQRQTGNSPRPQTPKIEQRGMPDVGHSQRPATHSPVPPKPSKESGPKK